MFQQTGAKNKVYPTFILGLIVFIVSGCGRTSGAADVVFGQSKSPVMRQVDGRVQSQDGWVDWVYNGAVTQNQDVIIRVLPHLHMGLLEPVGSAYRVESEQSGLSANLAIRYEESMLPFGRDEADLTLGKMKDNQWEAVQNVEVDVVENRVTGRVVSSNLADVYALIVRPVPSFSNSSFDGEVSGMGFPEGWVPTGSLHGQSGVLSLHENDLFLIQGQGQADSDPSLRQIIRGFMPGRNYVITGLFSGYGDCCEDPEVPSFGVAVDGQIVLERSRPLGEGLVPFSATLQATAEAHEVSFIAERNGSRTAYLIDDLAITPQRGMRLDVKKSGVGLGTVVSRPAGIQCGESCSASFPSGHLVTLVASAAPGFVFTEFNQEGCLGMSICTVTMDVANTVTATFSKASTSARLTRLEATLDWSYGGGRLEPDFDQENRRYRVSRIEQPGFVTFITETDEGATVRIGGNVGTSGQPVRLYFNGQDQVVPIVVVAQDGQTIRTYTVTLCRWYCVQKHPIRGQIGKEV